LGFNIRDVGKACDGLFAAIFEDLKIFGFQIFDWLSVFHDDRIDLHEVRGDPYDVVIGFGLGQAGQENTEHQAQREERFLVHR
jgi:hypothetical protein